MLVKNDKPASAGDFTWKGGDAVEVPLDFGNVICAIRDGGFYGINPEDEVRPPAYNVNVKIDGASVAEAVVKRGPGRPRKVQTEVDPESQP